MGQLLPVLDLLGGQVVHAVGGQRGNYRPIASKLTQSTEPLTVAKALAAVAGTREIYVADLDGLAGRNPDWETHEALAAAGFQLWLDVGLAVWNGGGHRHLPVRWILPTEMLPGPDAVEQHASKRAVADAIFSLDLRQGHAIGGSDPAEVWLAAAVAAGFRSLIVLDLAAVGTNEGPKTLTFCRQVRQSYPSLELTTGGGIRGPADVDACRDAGVDRVLVASALHAGVTFPPAIRSGPTAPDSLQLQPRAGGG